MEDTYAERNEGSPVIIAGRESNSLAYGKHIFLSEATKTGISFQVWNEKRTGRHAGSITLFLFHIPIPEEPPIAPTGYVWVDSQPIDTNGRKFRLVVPGEYAPEQDSIIAAIKTLSESCKYRKRLSATDEFVAHEGGQCGHAALNGLIIEHEARFGQSRGIIQRKNAFVVLETYLAFAYGIGNHAAVARAIGHRMKELEIKELVSK